MAVNRDNLILALEQYGAVVFCDAHNDIYYLVVMNNWTSDDNTFFQIANQYIVPNFPYLFTFSLIDGVLKAQYNLVG